MNYIDHKNFGSLNEKELAFIDETIKIGILATLILVKEERCEIPAIDNYCDFSDIFSLAKQDFSDITQWVKCTNLLLEY